MRVSEVFKRGGDLASEQRPKSHAVFELEKIAVIFRVGNFPAGKQIKLVRGVYPALTVPFKADIAVPVDYIKNLRRQSAVKRLKRGQSFSVSCKPNRNGGDALRVFKAA